jgi:hypothetical protein
LIYFIFTGENYDRTQESPVRKDLPHNQTVEKSGGQEPGSPTNSAENKEQTKPLSSAWVSALGAASAATMTRKRANARKQPIQNVRPQRALFCLTLNNPMRKLCIRVVEWRYPLFFYHIYVGLSHTKMYIRVEVHVYT